MNTSTPSFISKLRPTYCRPLGITIAIGLLVSLITASIALAQGPSLHPTFPLLDTDGNNVLETDNPISTMKTCGGCHDTEFIAEHSFHTDAGLSQFTEPGQVPGGHPWDTSPGFFGKWNPITYRYLTTTDDDLLDMSTADWIRQFGYRHVGGGPADIAPTGESLLEMHTTKILDPATGQTIPWDWTESGTVEMNCFLCHIPNPNNEARIEALESGNFKWANTATLLGTRIVTKTTNSSKELAWNPQAFNQDGNLAQPYITMQDPSNSNCGQCHGQVHTSNDIPLTQIGCEGDVATTGEIFAPQRMFKSGLNLQNKEDLSRSWDIHAERVVDCVDCHASLNNPVYFQGAKDTTLDHLLFDARRIDISDYLYRPLHQFAKGASAQSTVAPEFNNTMRRCEGCHDPNAVHAWLPYKEAHFANVSCESCHVPKIYAPAFQQVDWTVVNLDGDMQKACRGTEGNPNDVNTLITGFNPILLPQQRAEGGQPLAPFNLISAWYWVSETPARPVRQVDLQAAYLDGGSYRADVLSEFDSNDNGNLEEGELRLDTLAKENLIKQNLMALGLENPHIKAEVQPYSINHNVTNGEWATKECTACHSQNSRIAAPMQLADYIPGGVLPQFFGDESVAHAGEFVTADNGGLSYRPNLAEEGLYIFGYSNVPWIDWFGVLAFLGTTFGVSAHAGLRVYAAYKMPTPIHKYKRVYMYSVYERLWHWLQAAVIFLLILTGLIIHKPTMFGIFSFPYVVQVHNVLGLILLVNAFLSVFYHLASGEIKQYIPRPRGFFDQMITQATFYIGGIFKGEAHPFEKTPQKKLNPLQQITYFGLLNILLPLQILTGVIMWGMQTWPQLGQSLGGLPVLAPIHTLISWLLASFIVMHIYLTTTGHKALGSIKAMMDGWDEVEVLNEHQSPPKQVTHNAEPKSTEVA